MGTIDRPRLLGVGLDVVSISRLARIRARRDVLDHVCADEERILVDSDLGAARLWAGKEAVAKTLSTGFWQRGVDWLDIRFTVDGDVQLRGQAARIAGPCRFEIEYSQQKDMCVAVVYRWSIEPDGSSSD